jgi:hypothetical protein
MACVQKTVKFGLKLNIKLSVARRQLSRGSWGKRLPDVLATAMVSAGDR